MKRNNTGLKIRVFHQGNGVYLYCDCSDLHGKARYEVCTEPHRIKRVINANS